MKRNFTRIIIIFTVLLLMIAVLLPACSRQEPEKIVTSHETIYLEDPAPVKLELSAIPEGHTAAEYKWTAQGSQDNITVDKDGTVTLSEGTRGLNPYIVKAALSLKNLVYEETFSVLVRSKREEFGFSEDAITLLVPEDIRKLNEMGLSDHPQTKIKLDLVTDKPVISADPVVWESSDPEIADVDPDRTVTRIDAQITAKAPGTADVTASLGHYKATVHVTVKEPFDENTDVLPILSERAEESLRTEGSTAYVNIRDIGCTAIPEGKPGGGGKYMIRVDIEKNYEKDGKTYIKQFGIENQHDIGYAAENLRPSGIGFTSLLPKGIRAESMDDVSYIILITEAEAVRAGTYTNDAAGLERVVEARLLDALTGETLEILDSRRGRLEQSVYSTENAETIYSRLPTESSILDMIFKIVSEFWLEEYSSVVFLSGSSAYRYYGKDAVSIPDDLHIRKMYCTWPGTEIKSFRVPAETEIVYCSSWKKYKFQVAAGSSAETYCREHGIDYEIIE